jgi:hypothetical protein
MPHSRQWGIYFRGELLEGGFFLRAKALDAAEEWEKAHEAQKDDPRFHPEMNQN